MSQISFYFKFFGVFVFFVIVIPFTNEAYAVYYFYSYIFELYFDEKYFLEIPRFHCQLYLGNLFKKQAKLQHVLGLLKIYQYSIVRESRD